MWKRSRQCISDFFTPVASPLSRPVSLQSSPIPSPSPSRCLGEKPGCSPEALVNESFHCRNRIRRSDCCGTIDASVGARTRWSDPTRERTLRKGDSPIFAAAKPIHAATIGTVPCERLRLSGPSPNPTGHSNAFWSKWRRCLADGLARRQNVSVPHRQNPLLHPVLSHLTVCRKWCRNGVPVAMPAFSFA